MSDQIRTLIAYVALLGYQSLGRLGIGGGWFYRLKRR